MEDSVYRALAYLAQSQNPDGGWGYRPGHDSYVEPTALALVAFCKAGVAAPAGGWPWLRAAQRADGAWSVDRNGGDPSWMSAWAVWALAIGDQGPEALERGVRRLLAVPTLQVQDAVSQDQARQLFEIDPTLRGWPWQPGEAAWVWPTALALLALVAAGRREHPRLAEGLRYLRDRACPSGGWNFGNPMMIGKALPATLPETAVALLAVRACGLPGDDPPVVKGLGLLRRDIGETPAALEMAWGLLALRAWGEENPRVQAALIARQEAAGGWEGNPFITATAILALIDPIGNR